MGLWKKNCFFKNLPPNLLQLPKQCHISHFTKSRTIHWLKHSNFFSNDFQRISWNKKSWFWFITQRRKVVKTRAIVCKLLNFLKEVRKSHKNFNRHADQLPVFLGKVSWLCFYLYISVCCRKKKSDKALKVKLVILISISDHSFVKY